MISRISKRISLWLSKSGVIDPEENELYEYAVYSLFLTAIPLLLSLVIGICMGMTVESVLLILPFILIRKFSGGYHLNSPVKCMISSTLLLAGFLVGIRFVVPVMGLECFSILVIISFIEICLLSPVDSEARQLNKKEKKTFKKAAILLAGITIVVYTVLLLIGDGLYAVPVGAGMILTASLQLLCVPQIIRSRKATISSC